MWVPSGSQWDSLQEFEQQSNLKHGLLEALTSSGMQIDGKRHEAN
jgi:hypothetical protein